jgi:hypothetical protein
MPERGKTRGKYLSRKARNSIGFDLNRICAKKRKKTFASWKEKSRKIDGI